MTHLTPIDTTDEQDKVHARLEELRSEHRDLDDVIEQLSAEGPFNQLQIQRLKKRKLMLRDLIARLEDSLVPDIIA
ncbi:MAG: DUF465 domain-containing protein [Alphaproteobacteria bacterium]|nr:DUF465 domain-containing protein [Alphaproteobacteria bacterium SS10]